ncbi:MAG TPA: hypothetical protein VJU61_05520 [Polyangiaceae bacterium]|nr:hypothetical protein [Polyangiaceae bacterium]
MSQTSRFGSGSLRNGRSFLAALLCALGAGVACGGNAGGGDCEGQSCASVPGGSCSLDGVTYASGVSGIPAGDGCNSCSCEDGELGCTLMECETSTCHSGALTLADGASQLSSDGCNICTCNAGALACTDRACPTTPAGCEYAGERLADGESRPSTDGCNTCSCSDGQMLCTERGCNTTCYAAIDCPDGTYCTFPVSSCSAPSSGASYAAERPSPPGGGIGADPIEPGQCQARTAPCTDDYVPVCGCDGVTYSNACAAVNAGAQIATRTECL